jgi:protein-disulfide isomerase
LSDVARDLGFNLTAFDQCMASGKYRTSVQKDVNEGQRLGVTGTPTFFVNGRVLTGALPIAGFTRMIDDELSRISHETPGPR